MDEKQSPDDKTQHWEKRMESGIRRVQDALQTNQRQQGRLFESLLVAAGQTALDHMNDKLQEKQELRRRREEERRARLERRNRPSAAKGIVLGGAAAILIYLALLNPVALWWLLFVAFAFAMGSASVLSKAWAKKPSAAQLAARESEAKIADFKRQIDARLARVDAICDKIVDDIKAGPQAIREVVNRPEDTLKALRSASKELARRELELRTAITTEDEDRLRAERDALAFRIGAEKDEVVRLRLGSALQALDAQLAQRAELLTAASRFEAEGTRIVYTLENLRTQVLRARSADASAGEVAGAGLRLSLEQLGEEINAVAQALEEVNGAQAPMSRVQPVSDPGAEPGGRRSRKRDRT